LILKFNDILFATRTWGVVERLGYSDLCVPVALFVFHSFHHGARRASIGSSLIYDRQQIHLAVVPVADRLLTVLKKNKNWLLRGPAGPIRQDFV
jgi:hypothetical protein